MRAPARSVLHAIEGSPRTTLHSTLMLITVLSTPLSARVHLQSRVVTGGQSPPRPSVAPAHVPTMVPAPHVPLAQLKNPDMLLPARRLQLHNAKSINK
jgi:hypothetical protein